MKIETKIVRCPKCGSDEVYRILLKDVPLTKENADKIFSLLDEGVLNQQGSKLECQGCGHTWDNPEYLEQLINENISKGKFKEHEV